MPPATGHRPLALRHWVSTIFEIAATATESATAVRARKCWTITAQALASNKRLCAWDFHTDSHSIGFLDAVLGLGARKWQQLDALNQGGKEERVSVAAISGTVRRKIVGEGMRVVWQFQSPRFQEP
jgi:hypothetical protein